MTTKYCISCCIDLREEDKYCHECTSHCIESIPPLPVNYKERIENKKYINLEDIKKEISEAKKTFQKYKWPSIDVVDHPMLVSMIYTQFHCTSTDLCASHSKRHCNQ